MAKYRKKPIVIEAVQFNGIPVYGMCGSPCHRSRLESGEYAPSPHVHTIHANQIVLVEHGDWIIPEPDGEHFYPCKPDIFEATYDLAGEGNNEI